MASKPDHKMKNINFPNAMIPELTGIAKANHRFFGAQVLVFCEEGMSRLRGLKPNSKLVDVVISDELHDRITRDARLERRSFNDQVAYTLEKAYMK